MTIHKTSKLPHYYSFVSSKCIVVLAFGGFTSLPQTPPAFKPSLSFHAPTSNLEFLHLICPRAERVVTRTTVGIRSRDDLRTLSLSFPRVERVLTDPHPLLTCPRVERLAGSSGSGGVGATRFATSLARPSAGKRSSIWEPVAGVVPFSTSPYLSQAPGAWSSAPVLPMVV